MPCSIEEPNTRMGDYYQTIADIDADAQSAGELAKRLCEWMISRRIIVPEKSDCVMDKTLGHSPGENYELAAKQTNDLLFKLTTNGARFISERTVFYAGGGKDPTLVCPRCDMRFEYNDEWSAAIGEWFEGKGPGLLACVHCHAEAPITEWQHDPLWAFGYLGVEFWNWPDLRPEFIDDVSKFLGHRVRLVRGKF
jgi:hypothetical protein